MQQTTQAIVLKLHKVEDDRILTLLTKNKGVVTAFANGANKLRSRLAGSTELLCYSHFVLFTNKGRHVVDSADSLRIFFGIRSDVEKLALASYFAQLATELAPHEEEAEVYLSLLLNTLHLLEAGKRPLPQLKAIYELRLLTLAGFMPNLIACKSCGCYEADTMLFFPGQGDLLCTGCATGGEVGHIPLPLGVLAAMRHILYSQGDKLFSFSLSPQGLAYLEKVCEEYLRYQVEKTFTALDFYKSLGIPGGTGY